MSETPILAEAAHRRKKLPRFILQKPGMPVFEGYHLEERRPWWPVFVGASVFATAYASAIALGVMGTKTSKSPHAFEPMFIPAVGPFMAFGTAGDLLEQDSERAVIAMSGGFQIAGLGVAVLRWVLPRKRLLVLDAKVEITPLVSPGSTGLAATF